MLSALYIPYSSTENFRQSFSALSIAMQIKLRLSRVSVCYAINFSN